MTIFEAVKTIKDEVEKGTNQMDLLPKLANETGIELEKLELYSKLYSVEKENRHRTQTGMTAWHMSEKILIMLLMLEVEGVISKTKVFKILSENNLINRSYSSITFYYYNDVVDMKKNKEHYIQEAYRMYEEIGTENKITKSIPEAKKKNLKAKEKKQPLEENSVVIAKVPTNQVKKLDSLDHLTSIIQNVQHLEGFNLESFLGGLSTLTNLAVKENDTSEIEALREKTSEQEKEILGLKQKLNLVTQALNEYDSLDTLQQVAQLRGYTKQIRDSVK